MPKSPEVQHSHAQKQCKTEACFEREQLKHTRIAPSVSKTCLRSFWCYPSPTLLREKPRQPLNSEKSPRPLKYKCHFPLPPPPKKQKNKNNPPPPRPGIYEHGGFPAKRTKNPGARINRGSPFPALELQVERLRTHNLPATEEPGTNPGLVLILFSGNPNSMSTHVGTPGAKPIHALKEVWRANSCCRKYIRHMYSASS